jgi:hypothetical protein
LKSLCTSVAFPAFLLGHDPTRRIICVSYSEGLAAKHANDCRALMHSPKYRRIFPTRISRAKDTELEIMTTARGFRLGSGLIKSTIQEPQQDTQRRESCRPTCHSGWRCV